MSFEFSAFGRRFARPTGILELMDDLGHAMSGDNPALMLGGGNPGRIPEVEAVFRERLHRIADDDAAFGAGFANYAHPAGETRMREAVAELLNEELQWPVSAENVALTASGQTTFFLLFNLLSGAMSDGRKKKVLLPLTPEYIGYTDQGLQADTFVSAAPVIEELPEQMFKYRVDFSELQIDENIGAVCLSRPTNPTGNVVTDNEMARLDTMCRDAGVPLIVDSAYGAPFPGIVFTPSQPHWNSNTIFCMSLSKLGLPGVRTGIVVASPQIVQALTQINATMQLAVGSVGPVMVTELLRSREILALSRDVIMPYYRDKAFACVERLHAALDGVEHRIHRPEGAMFLWLWLPGLPIASALLYEKLKRAGVLVLSGHHFFPGVDTSRRHCHECLRISFSMDDSIVQRGIEIIGEVVRDIYRNPQAAQQRQ